MESVLFEILGSMPSQLEKSLRVSFFEMYTKTDEQIDGEQSKIKAVPCLEHCPSKIWLRLVTRAIEE